MAVAHSIIVSAFHNESYQVLEANYLDKHHHVHHVNQLMRRLERLGYRAASTRCRPRHRELFSK